MNRPTDAEQLTREQIERIRATFRMFGVGEEQRSRLSVLCDMALASLSASAPLSETPARAPVSATGALPDALMRRIRTLAEDFRNPCFGSKIHNEIPYTVGLAVLEWLAATDSRKA